MRKFFLASSFLIAAFLPTAADAQARTCGDLWWRRNSEYKSAGYCFHTARAIRTFGNAGCQYDDVNEVPLSESQRAILRDLRELEREMGCR
jgi:hypothetical protein